MLRQINESDISIYLLTERINDQFVNESVKFNLSLPSENDTFDQLTLQLSFKNPELISQTAVTFDF
jgi:hypothetical protein